jgi:hypothetical protein
MLSSSPRIGFLVSDFGAHNFILESRPGCQNSAHSLVNADETNSISSLIGDMTYSIMLYVMTRLTMGTPLSKSPPRVLIGRMKITLYAGPEI